MDEASDMPDETFLDRVIATVSRTMPDLADELRLSTRDMANERQALMLVADHLDRIVSTPLRSAFELSDYLEWMELNPRNAFVEMRGQDAADRESSVLHYRLLPEPILSERRMLQKAAATLDAFTSSIRAHYADPDPDPEPGGGFRPGGGSSPSTDAPLRGRRESADPRPRNTPFRRKRQG